MKVYKARSLFYLFTYLFSSECCFFLMTSIIWQKKKLPYLKYSSKCNTRLLYQSWFYVVKNICECLLLYTFKVLRHQKAWQFLFPHNTDASVTMGFHTPLGDPWTLLSAKYAKFWRPPKPWIDGTLVGSELCYLDKRTLHVVSRKVIHGYINQVFLAWKWAGAPATCQQSG